MIYGARKFNQDSYDKNDYFAREKFSEFIIRKGHLIIKNEEDYNHDLQTVKNNKKYLFELEVKSKYVFTDRDSFPFQTVSFLGRKKRLHDFMPFYYVIICRETEWALVCHSENIFIDDYVENIEINTLHRIGNDELYRVPKNKCLFFDINEKLY